MGGLVRSGGLQHGHDGRRAAVISRNMLMGTGAGTKQVTGFIVASTEAVSRWWALEPTHRLVSTFDAAVILFQALVEVAAGAVLYGFTQPRPDRAWIAVVAIRGPPVRGDVGDDLGGLEEGRTPSPPPCRDVR